MIAHTGQIFDPTTPHQYHRVFLQTMPLAGNISSDLNAIRITSYNVCYTKLLRLLREEEESVPGNYGYKVPRSLLDRGIYVPTST